MPSLRHLLALVLCSAVVLGCKAERGDQCKEDNDCSGSLVCCKMVGGAEERGICGDPACDMVLPGDGGMTDGGDTDGGETDGGPVDGSADAAMSMDAATDGGPVDGSADAAMSMDAATDAGGEDSGVDGGGMAQDAATMDGAASDAAGAADAGNGS